MNFQTKNIIAGLMLTSVLTSCATVEQAASDLDAAANRIFTGSYATQEVDPVCYMERTALVESGEFFDKALIAATVGGAAIGALTALIAGENVVEGAIIGGVSGLALGYISKLQGEGGAYHVLSTSLTDVREENAKIEKFTNSVRALNRCRKNEAAAIRKDLKDLIITRPQAEERMAAVRMRHTEDVERAQKVSEEIIVHSTTYVDAYNQIAADNGRKGLQVDEYRPKRERRRRGSARRSNKVPKRVTTNENQASLKVNKNQRRDLRKLEKETVTNVNKRDDSLDSIAEAEASGKDGSFTL